MLARRSALTLSGVPVLPAAAQSVWLLARPKGRLRGIAQASDTRWAGLPTTRELVIEVLGSASRGFVAPAGLPDELAHRLIAAFAAMLADPALIRGGGAPGHATATGGRAGRPGHGAGSADGVARALSARRWTQN